MIIDHRPEPTGFVSQQGLGPSRAPESLDLQLGGYDRYMSIKDTGTILGETAIEGTPDGIPAVYEVDGREYAAFFAAGGGGDGIIVKKTKPEAERYNFSIHAKKRNTAEPVSALSLAPLLESIQ